jgi:hypothetical protein
MKPCIKILQIVNKLKFILVSEAASNPERIKKEPIKNVKMNENKTLNLLLKSKE